MKTAPVEPKGDPDGPPDPVREAFARESSSLWALLYRMTGVAADADDLLQETFARALERPPADLSAPLGPWLTRVALNLSRDHLRKRRRRETSPAWLPAPIRSGGEVEGEGARAEVPSGLHGSYEPTLATGASAAHRYDLLESVSFAFLLTLEVLTPIQRAVLLLRDVFDYTGQEAAAALDLTEANTRQVHLRARKKIEAYRDRRPVFTAANREVVGAFLEKITAGDLPGIEALLSDDVRAISDGGDQFRAALRPIEGRDKVARLFAKLATKSQVVAVEVCELNGAPAVLVDVGGDDPRQAKRFALLFDFDRGGVISALYVVLTPRKLAHVTP